MTAEDWRDGLESIPVYKRKFAYLPIVTSADDRVWMKFYYKKYVSYHTNYGASLQVFDDDYQHTDFVENISEEEFVVRKLSEKY